MIRPGQLTSVRLGLLLARVNADVEYVAAAQDHVSVVRSWGVPAVFRGAFQNDVHVAVGVNHPPAILNIVLKPNVDFRV